jgi:hypothetical protein
MSDTTICTLCDAEIDEDGRVGHLKFSDGDGHGENGEFPPEYDDNPGAYFAEASGDHGDPESDDEGESETESDDPDDDEGNGSDPDDEGQRTDETAETPASNSEGGSGNANSADETDEATDVLGSLWEKLNQPIFDQQ